MGIYGDQILPRLMDKVLGSEDMATVRSRTVAEIRGVVCELGFGSGPNVPLYPAGVERVHAVEPSAVAWRLAAARVAASPVPIDVVGLDGQDLPLADDSVDTVLSTWTLCSIPDVERALAEVRRVLRPGGRLVFLEHGLSSDERVARRQRRYTPVQKRIAGGCHLDRDIEALVSSSGLHLEQVAHFQIAGPKTMSAMCAGVATDGP